jgi:hypothetical protein
LSSVKDDGMDPSEVEGGNLLVCSPTVPGFSLGNSRWGEYLILFCCSSNFPPVNTSI